MDVKKLQTEIRKKLTEKKGILLAHNYQLPEIHDVADLTGDSLELSIKAASTEAEVIVFCGVRFMAETAAIVCPNKVVILPVLSAGCPMADMITAEQLRAKKTELPGTPVVTYVNSTAEVKAESDICCTSANAIQVVNSLVQADTVFMTPDKNLAKYTQRHSSKKILHWDGYCPIHNNLTAEEVIACKQKYPKAVFMAHPECPPEVLELADEIKSTSGMLAFARESDRTEFIVGTEQGLIYPMQRDNPGKKFYSPSEKLICPDMKKTTLAVLLQALEEMTNIITVPEHIRVKALTAVKRMLAIPKG
ncbi:MAG: quinolinate synthase NadA [Deltaproteobacteria bacterium]|nr:quinolinate synthase NadA [Deltaproteobacteria bacterium]